MDLGDALDFIWSLAAISPCCAIILEISKNKTQLRHKESGALWHGSGMVKDEEEKNYEEMERRNSQIGVKWHFAVDLSKLKTEFNEKYRKYWKYCRK